MATYGLKDKVNLFQSLHHRVNGEPFLRYLMRVKYAVNVMAASPNATDEWTKVMFVSGLTQVEEEFCYSHLDSAIEDLVALLHQKFTSPQIVTIKQETESEHVDGVSSLPHQLEEINSEGISTCAKVEKMDLQSEAEMPVEPTKPVDVKKLGITKDRYSCKECKSAFQSRRHVLNHVSLKHGVVNHAEQDMMINVKIKHNYSCKECSSSFLYKKEIMEHLVEKHDVVETAAQDLMIEEAPRPFLCDQCTAAFHTKESLTSHIRTVHLKTLPFSCKQCEKSFRDKKCLELHIDTHTGLKNFHCDKCPTSFSTDHNLKRHMKVHLSSEERLVYGCVKCDAVFSVKHQLKLHCMNEHDQPLENYKTLPLAATKQFKNKTTTIGSRKPCVKSNTKSAEALIKEGHIVVVSPEEEKTLCCLACDFQTTVNDALSEHIKDHHDGQKYHCRECTKYFNAKGLLHRHYFAHHNKDLPIYGKIYHCKIGDCTHKASFLDAITSHLVHKHNFSDSFLTYESSSKMYKYEKKYKCKTCDYGASHPTFLARHEAIHSQSLDKRKTLSCPHCDKKFAQSGHLHTHVRNIHLKVKTHQCKICETFYAQSNNLIEHIAIKHMGFKDGKEWRKNKTQDLHVQARNHPAFVDLTKTSVPFKQTLANHSD